MSGKKLTPKEFSVALRDALKAGAVATPIALIVKNKRGFYEKVVKEYEDRKVCYSRSGMTAAIVMAWLQNQRRSYVLRCSVSADGQPFYTLSEQ